MASDLADAVGGAERVQGLGQLLEVARLLQYREAAEAWCNEVGAVDASEIAEAAEEFADALKLKLLERRRLLKVTAQWPPLAATSDSQRPESDSGSRECLLEVQVELRNPGASLASLGLLLDTRNEAELRVAGIRQGAVEAWNAANPGRRIAVGDRIVAVNGAVGDAEAMIRKLDRMEDLQLAVLKRATFAAEESDLEEEDVEVRLDDDEEVDETEAAEEPAPPPPEPEEFPVQLRNWRRKMAALGIHVDHSDGQTLRVEWVAQGGLFEDWNSHNPLQQVCVGDRIVSVNERSGDSIALINELGRSECLQLVVRHFPQQHAAQPSHSASSKVSKASSRWLRVVQQPNVLCRWQPSRDAAVVTSLEYNEVIEVDQRRNGWARLSAAELKRHKLLPNYQAWVLEDVRSLGLPQQLAPVPPPPAHVLEANGIIVWSLNDASPNDVEPSSQARDATKADEVEVERVVAENDAAWEALQAQRGRLRAPPRRAAHSRGLLPPSQDRVVPLGLGVGPVPAH